MANHLTKITTRAKQIRKAHPSISWTSAIKKASAEYRGTKKAAPKRKTVKHTRKKAAPRKRARVKAIGSQPAARRVSGTSISGLKGQLKNHYKEQLGKELVKRDLATKKSEKRKLTKKITEIRSNLKKIM